MIELIQSMDVENMIRIGDAWEVKNPSEKDRNPRELHPREKGQKSLSFLDLGRGLDPGNNGTVANGTIDGIEMP